MNDQEYIEQLERLVCFLAKCYMDCDRVYYDQHMKAAAEYNRELTPKEWDEIKRFPQIEGFANRIIVAKLGALLPEHNLDLKGVSTRLFQTHSSKA